MTNPEIALMTLACFEIGWLIGMSLYNWITYD